MITIGGTYKGRETGREIIVKWIWRDHEIQETFVVYLRPGGKLEEIRIKVFKQFYKLITT